LQSGSKGNKIYNLIYEFGITNPKQQRVAFDKPAEWALALSGLKTKARVTEFENETV